ncbi:ligand-binding sensor domain-containing diguanylate cyclase [Xanthomonas melonis]|uniref:diguanylate cyclase n=1 Tax=Xanthomonas melonis TaxID=56456 RepID=A0A2S7DAU0_9XANT|nr:ligand-binding sensor domain-containing diguanylate cyclase [Xanthomonas melonis]MCC4599647.1 diguanylate cyclase [Xanthomonas melonis]PPU70935.1 hypothetical protein XmelCFBP4644_18170 [Xanthomonas melonis]
MLNLPALFASSVLRCAVAWAWLWLLAIGWGLGCAGTAAAQSFSFRDYAQAEGLQGMTITGLIEDRSGVVWVATESALHRFERDRFIAVGQDQGLDARFTRALALDQAGRLWVATNNGVFVRDRARFVPVLHDGRRIRAAAGNVIAAYRDGVAVIGNGELLALAPGAGGRWTVQTLALRTPDGTAMKPGPALLADGQFLWLPCDAAICRLDVSGAVVERLSEADGVPQRRWRVIFRERGGRLWLRGGGIMLSRAPGATRFQEHPANPYNGFTTMSGATTMVEDARGRMLTRSDHGLVRWEGTHWTDIGSEQGLSLDAMVGPLLLQSNGTLWIGTRGLGLQRLIGYGSIEHLTEAQGMPSAPTWAIQRLPDGMLAVGADGGASLLARHATRALPWQTEDGKPLSQALSIAVAPDGAAWVSYYSGAIARRDPLTGATRGVMDLPRPAYKLLFDKHGSVWIASPRGLVRGQAHPPYAMTTEPALAGKFVGDIDFDGAGRLWAATSDGLFRRDGDGWVHVPVHGALPSQDTFQIDFAPDGQIWLSLRDNGLWHGRLQPDGSLAVRAVDDPLLSKVMPFILRHDREGRLWVGSSQGLDLYAHGRWSRITRAEGLLWDDLSANAFFEDDDGSIWIGSSRGLSHLRDPQRLFAMQPLQVEISQVRRGNQEVRAGSTLDWSETPLDIELRTPGTEGSPDRISFRYRVEGHQARWTTTTLSHLTYPLLPPGRYTLEVQALDAYQRHASPIARLHFVLRPPWWRGTPAIAGYLLLAIAAVIALLRWRTAKLLRRKRELEHLVAERTAELEQDKRELEAARAELTLKASHDELTGLLNRAGILAALRCLLQRADPPTRPLAVVLIDLDHFKQVNDQHGHLAGDAVLAGVGRRLDALVRGDDRVGRYGGEELLALLPGLQRGATHRLEDLHRGICGDYRIDGASLHITCSAGVAWLQPAETLEHLLARADAALYRAKRDGRNRIAYADQTPLTGAPASDDR